MNRLLILLLLCAVSFFSCERSNGTTTVDIINVVREGATIPAYIYGNTDSKTFVIILHGGPGGSGLEYKFGDYTTLLETNYAVVYTDQRGQGMSQSNSSAPVNSLELMTEDVYALALSLREKYGDDLNLFLMGHSWGGLLGTSVILNPTYSQQFDGWIEVDGAHDFPMVYTSGHAAMDSICNVMLSAGINAPIYEGFLERLSAVNINDVTLENFSVINALAFEVEAQLTTDNLIQVGDPANAGESIKYQFFVNNWLTSQITGSVTNNLLFANDLFSVSFTNDLRSITTPTLLLWGALDMVVPQALGISAFNEIEIEEKELIIFNESGHSPMDNESQLFGEVVIEFIEKYK